MVTDIGMFGSPNLSPVEFWWCWMKREVDTRKVDTGDESLAPSLYVAVPREETRTSTETNNTRSFSHEV